MKYIKTIIILLFFISILYSVISDTFPLGSIILRNIVALSILKQTYNETPLLTECGIHWNINRMTNLASLATDWNPNDPVALRLYGNILWLGGNCDEAIEVLQKADDLSEKQYLITKFDLACYLFVNGQKDRAVQEFKKINAGKHIYIIAADEWRNNRKDSAKMIYELAIEIEPMFPQAITLAQIYKDEGNNEGAIQVWLRLSGSINKNDSNHWLTLGEAYVLNQEWQEARAAYLKGIELSKNQANLYLRLGDTLVHLENWVEATESYLKAIELDPKSSIWPYYSLGNIALTQGQYEEAVKWYDMGRNVYPLSESPDLWVGLAALQTNRLIEAESRLNSAYKTNPENGDVLSALGKLKQAQGDWISAASFTEQSAQKYYLVGQLSNYCNELKELISIYTHINDSENQLQIEQDQIKFCVQ